MNIVVIGGGLAAANAVAELRDRGYTGDLTLVGAEPHLPYERPPLSKGLLLGSDEPDSVFVHDRAWYDEHQVTLRLGTRATGLDRDRKQVLLGSEELPYDRLILTTGSTPRRLPALEAGSIPVRSLRTLDDSLALKKELAGHLLLVGAGWIGLEIAAAARQAGGEVTIAETAAWPLLGVLGPELAPLFAELHRSHGVDLRLSTSVDRVEGAEVLLSDGTRVRPDLIVAGVGAVPDDGLAAHSGLATDNGILVDARLATADPAVFAAGDVANHDHPSLGRIRVEHWDNAIEQGKHVAGSVLGDTTPYTRQPYFFSDQYDLGMEYLGHVGRRGYDELIVRGDRANLTLVALWVRGGTVVAGLHLNDWDAADSLRLLVGATPENLDALRDESVPLPRPDEG
ncbi:FAD-dependent oxidoreductase [Micropruina sp.]|uniref:NAD(P)/FAD-dependent oxidoreductase n=1 Tax=Micropruina sp. TaxID=2737536 RepID=UPI0026174BCB|nr:FAD-dependent oxidoreductase [Micropruina sp.]